MVLFRALGWLLLAMAVGTVVYDALICWSEGVLRLSPFGELWSRLDPASLERAQAAVQHHLPVGLWTGVVLLVLKLPALPVFVIAGVLLLWIGRRSGNASDAGFLGARPPRRRRARSGLS